MEDSEHIIGKTEGIDDVPKGPVALHSVTALSGMYQDWFLDYASYVILERAVPHLDDGLKPVHRRIRTGSYWCIATRPQPWCSHVRHRPAIWAWPF